MKRGMALWYVIGAVLALVVLIVLIAAFTNLFGGGAQEIGKAQESGKAQTQLFQGGSQVQGQACGYGKAGTCGSLPCKEGTVLTIGLPAYQRCRDGLACCKKPAKKEATA